MKSFIVAIIAFVMIARSSVADECPSTFDVHTGHGYQDSDPLQVVDSDSSDSYVMENAFSIFITPQTTTL
jgi:hypothetical protein